jgi:HlyD family secretion protein
MQLAFRKHPVISIAVIVIIALLIWGYWPQAVLVEAVAVTRGPMVVTIEEEGRTRVIDRYIISAPVDGVTCRMELHVGDPVEKGEVLLSISPLESQVLDPRSRAQAEANVLAAESKLHAAEEQVRAAAAAEELATTELTRLKSLLERNLISQGVYDKAVTEKRTTQANKRSADFNVEVARYELEAARTMLERNFDEDFEVNAKIPIRSPIDGRILKVQRECEGAVRTGEPLVEVGDPGLLEVEVDLLSADAVKIKQGMKVLFDRWGGEQPLEGIVRLIEPVGFTKVSALGVEEQRVMVISDFTSPAGQWQRLGDGYRVEAQFLLWQEDNVLQIPSSSLFRYQQGWAVFVIENNRAVRRMVAIGQRNGLLAEIVDGLKQGDVVINHPSDAVDDGVRVSARD